MQFGDKLRMLRAQKKMTQAELAQRSGIPRGDISRIEMNRFWRELASRSASARRWAGRMRWTRCWNRSAR